MSEIIFNWYAPAVVFEILRVVGSYLSARVYFTIPAKDDANLRNPEYYSIVHDESDQVGFLDVYSVTPEDTEFPTYVDLECGDLTDDKDYELTITTAKISNSDESKLLEEPNNVAVYEGVSIFPEVVTVQATSERTMLVSFNKDMSPNDSLFDAGSYTFTGDLVTQQVTRISPGVVELLTSKQTPSVLYELTVTSLAVPSGS